ncbi:Lrp/AsnC family transcriptional regulator [Halomarina litorea]|uniref:Lrp/AsnC family transcriptional regulator n=1 Tax=Halomarina litorea TaxID=2961595 RepID=UPI0020C47CAB|nr:Lrp/AsnC family transcriptional regulator [Halomarina sp. BCD28]
MVEFDDLDRQILDLLLEDARRSFREIADEIGRSAPTVSNRVDRLRELGVIRRFTLDIDRSMLTTGEQSLVVARVQPSAAEPLADALADDEAVEHVLRGVGGTVVAKATVDTSTLDGLLGDLSEAYPDADWSVEPLVGTRWDPHLGVTGGFGLVCTVCGNTITEDGVDVEVESGNRHVVCCSTCAADITEQYERLADAE